MGFGVKSSVPRFSAVPHRAAQRGAFQTTQWGQILTAAHQPDAVSGQVALENLCKAYWKPLYAFICRQGYRVQDAEDLTQGFLFRLLEGRLLKEVERGRGRFRSYLLVSLKHYLADHRKHVNAQKRGGAVTILSLEDNEAGRASQQVVTNDTSPDRLFDREWALLLLERSLEQLEAKYKARGKADWYFHLRSCLGGGEEFRAYPEIANALGLKENAARTAVHRFQKEFAVILRRELAATVSDPAEIDDELRYLIEVTRQ